MLIWNNVARNERHSKMGVIGRLIIIILLLIFSLFITGCNTSAGVTSEADNTTQEIQGTQLVEIDYTASLYGYFDDEYDEMVPGRFVTYLPEEDKAGIAGLDKGEIIFFTIRAEGGGETKDFNFTFFRETSERGGGYVVAMETERGKKWAYLDLSFEEDEQDNSVRWIVASLDGEKILSWKDNYAISEIWLHSSEFTRTILPGFAVGGKIEVKTGSVVGMGREIDERLPHLIEICPEGSEDIQALNQAIEDINTVQEIYPGLEVGREGIFLMLHYEEFHRIFGRVCGGRIHIEITRESGDTQNAIKQTEEVEYRTHSLSRLKVSDRGFGFIRLEYAPEPWDWYVIKKGEWNEQVPEMTRGYLEALSHESMLDWFGKLEITYQGTTDSLKPRYDPVWGIVWEDGDGEIRLVDFITGENIDGGLTMRRTLYSQAGRLIVLTGLNLGDYFDVSGADAEYIQNLFRTIAAYHSIDYPSYEGFLNFKDGAVVLVMLESIKDLYVRDDTFLTEGGTYDGGGGWIFVNYQRTEIDRSVKFRMAHFASVGVTFSALLEGENMIAYAFMSGDPNEPYSPSMVVLQGLVGGAKLRADRYIFDAYEDNIDQLLADGVFEIPPEERQVLIEVAIE